MSLSRPEAGHWGTSLIRKRTPLGPYREPMCRVLEGCIFLWARKPCIWSLLEKVAGPSVPSRVDVIGARDKLEARVFSRESWGVAVSRLAHRVTSLIRKRTPPGTYRRPMPRVLGG